MLASFEKSLIQYRAGDNVMSSDYASKPDMVTDGKFGSSRRLAVENEMTVPVSFQLSNAAGAIEFWQMEQSEPEIKKTLLELTLKTKNEELALTSHRIGHSKRRLFQLTMKDRSLDPVEQGFSTPVRSRRWNHFLLAWEDGVMYLLQNGSLASRKEIDMASLIPEDKIVQIVLRGEMCFFDDLRISNASRLSHIIDKKEVELRPEVVERLKALGYIK